MNYKKSLLSHITIILLCTVQSLYNAMFGPMLSGNGIKKGQKLIWIDTVFYFRSRIFYQLMCSVHLLGQINIARCISVLDFFIIAN